MGGDHWSSSGPVCPHFVLVFLCFVLTYKAEVYLFILLRTFAAVTITFPSVPSSYGGPLWRRQIAWGAPWGPPLGAPNLLPYGVCSVHKFSSFVCFLLIRIKKSITTVSSLLSPSAALQGGPRGPNVPSSRGPQQWSEGPRGPPLPSSPLGAP